MSLGLQFVKALLTDNNAGPLRDVRPEFFVKEETPVINFVKKHMSRHGVLPDSDTLLENGHRLTRATEPASYYAAKLRERYVYTLIRSKAPALSAAMKEKNVEAAVELIRELSTLSAHVLEPDSFSSLELESGQLWADYCQVKESGEIDLGIPFGWPAIDQMTMGMQGGDLIVLAGRPNVGKTWIMLAAAYNAWLSGKSVGILSLEMTKKQIVRRFVSFITKANPNLLRTGSLSTWGESLLRGAIRGFRRTPPVWINSSNMRNKSTGLIDKLLGEHLPDVVFVDSAYRLTPVESRNNMVGHERMAQVVHELKQLALDYDRPIVAVNQYNRSVKQAQKNSAELGSAAGTDSWEQDSSIFIGIRKGPAPFEDSSRYLDLTKDREGPTGETRINFGFSPIDFSQIEGVEEFAIEDDSEWGE